jgi:hypothetical protein
VKTTFAQRFAERTARRLERPRARADQSPAADATGTDATGTDATGTDTTGNGGPTRRSFLAKTAVIGSALVVAPRKFLLEPVSAYDAVCGPANQCGDGYTVFCCTINNGVNACPPGTFAGGWWKADRSSWCCGGTARYYIDCQGSCTRCGCRGSAFCSPSCNNCPARCNGGPTCDQRRVCWNYFRYGQCHQEIGCSGPVACRVVSCVPPWQIAGLACTAATATDNRTAEHSAPCLTPGCDSAVEQHYWNLGGPLSVLGSPTTTLQRTPDGIGQYEHYQNGSIYWSPSTGAWEVHGSIRAHWAALGWETGAVGYPISDENGTPDGIGRYNHFQRGSIYWTPSTGAREVRGAIRSHWADLGWEKSAVGYPISDENGTPDGIGRYNQFQHGLIYWTLTTGAREIHGPILNSFISVGATRSPLGFPTSDVTPTLLGARSTFQGGYIDWNKLTGQTSIVYT